MGKFEENQGCQNEYLWKDKKRPILGLPLSFTEYILTNEKLLINAGFLSTSQEEIRLYRIMDLTVRCSLLQKIFNVGTIHCCSADKSTPEFDIIDVKNPLKVKDLISKSIEEEKERKKIASRELINYDEDEHI